MHNPKMFLLYEFQVLHLQKQLLNQETYAGDLLEKIPQDTESEFTISLQAQHIRDLQQELQVYYYPIETLQDNVFFSCYLHICMYNKKRIYFGSTEAQIDN